MLLSLVIPTYNERPNIAPLIERITRALEQVSQNFEIIIVDDDSPDGTWQVTEALAGENPHLRAIRRRGERGLATAVVAGWKAAKGEMLGVMDGDLQQPPETLPELLSALRNHRQGDIAVASRHVAGGGVSGWSILRKLVSWGGTMLATLMLPGIARLVRDPMSGYFLMKRSVIDSVSLKPRGYKILLEVLARGKYQTVVEVPYIFTERKQGGSKLGPRQHLDFLLHLWQLARETKNQLHT